MQDVVFYHFSEGDRFEVIDVYAGVEHSFRLGDQRPVFRIRVAVNMPKYHVSAHHMWPGHHGVVTQCYLSLSVRERGEGADAFKIAAYITVLHPVSVMITNDQMLLSTQLPEVLLRRLFISEHQISKDIHRVMGVYTLVPVMNQDLVHFLNTAKWAITQANDIFMPQMQVTCKIDYSESRAFLNASLIASASSGVYIQPNFSQ